MSARVMSPRFMSPRVLRWSAGIGMSVLLATGAIGWMHTPAGIRFLAAVGVPCPVQTVSVERVDRLRGAGLAALPPAPAAPARPVPAGLHLDVTTEAEATAMMSRMKAHCEPQVRGYHFLRCRGVDAAALGLAGPAVSEMWLSFNRSGRLAGVDIYRRGMAADDLRTVWKATARYLGTALGAPTVAFGDPAPEALSARPLDVARLQYRYADYVATMTASHMPQTGLAVREQYVSGRL
jgi:hypothetical protein